MVNLEVNHKDGNKENNNIENLEWCTKSENQKHAYRTGIKIHPMLGKRHSDKTKYKYQKIIQFKKVN